MPTTPTTPQQRLRTPAKPELSSTTKTSAPSAMEAKVKPSKFTPTWHHRPRAEMSFFEKSLIDLGVLQDQAGSKAPPIHPIDAPVPVVSPWHQHFWVLKRATPPLLINLLFVAATGINVPRAVAGVLYTMYFIFYGSCIFTSLSRTVKQFGVFDGAHPRDGIPDKDTRHVAIELAMVVVLRAVVAFTFIYPDDQTALINWKNVFCLPVSLFAHAVTLDFFFYWYHRLMHEVPWLWQFHRKHHTTKHPSAAHGAYADHEQEFFDILGIPFLTYTALYFTPLRLDFASWWMCISYTLFIEAGGHSGIRAYLSNPMTYYPLQPLGLELVLEDHDLHHRRGWRKSSNYGKQTRLWDWMFGTIGERIECSQANIDWSAKVQMQ